MSRSRSTGASASSSKTILTILGKRKSASTGSLPKQEPEKKHKNPLGKADKVSAESALEKTNTQGAIEIHGSLPTLFQQESYDMLSRQLAILPTSKLSCRGRSSREIITLDLQTAALKDFLRNFLARCEVNRFCDSQAATQSQNEDSLDDTEGSKALQEPNHPELLQNLVALVRSTLLNPGSEAELKKLIIEESLKRNLAADEKVAPLEWFVNFGKGYCRHHSLLTAYLLVNLIDAHAKENSSTYEDTKSRIYRYRTTNLQPLEQSAKPVSHSVIIYESINGQRYLLDASRKGLDDKGLVLDLSNLTAKDKEFLREQYLPYQGAQFIQKINQVYDKLAQQNTAAPIKVSSPKF